MIFERLPVEHLLVGIFDCGKNGFGTLTIHPYVKEILVCRKIHDQRLNLVAQGEQVHILYDPDHGSGFAVVEAFNFTSKRAFWRLIPSWLLRQNPVNYRKAKGHFFIPGVLDMPNELGYEYKNTVIFGDEELHVITAEAYDFLATYTLYISTKDYALLRVDLQAKSTEQKFIHHNPSDPRFRMLFIDNTLRFRRIDGKPYLDYMRMHWEWEKYDSLTGREEEGELYKELVVNDVFADPAKVDVVKRQMKTAAITPGESLYEKARPYDAIFWSYYNVIKDNPLNTRLQRALDASGKTFEQSLD